MNNKPAQLTVGATWNRDTIEIHYKTAYDGKWKRCIGVFNTVEEAKASIRKAKRDEKEDAWLVTAKSGNILYRFVRVVATCEVVA